MRACMGVTGGLGAIAVQIIRAPHGARVVVLWEGIRRKERNCGSGLMPVFAMVVRSGRKK